MKHIDNWLKKCTILGLMQIFTITLLAPIFIGTFLPTAISFAVLLLFFALSWRMRKEAIRRDDLIKSWGSNKIFVVNNKHT